MTIPPNHPANLAEVVLAKSISFTLNGGKVSVAADGSWMLQLPMTPERVRKALDLHQTIKT